MTNLLLPAVIAALVAILFGSVAAAFVSHILSSVRADKEYRLKKLEEMAESVEAASRALLQHYHELVNVARGAQTWLEAYEKGIDAYMESYGHFSRAMTIAQIYFPDLSHAIDRLSTLDIEANEQKKAFMDVHEDGVPSAKFESFFKDAISRLRRLRSEAHQRIFESAREVRRGRVVTWFRNSFS